jgi:purine-nucleoside phosphorylase
MYRENIEVKKDADIGIIIEKSSWFSVIEKLYQDKERIYYPNDQDEILYVKRHGFNVAFIAGQGSSMAACMTERLRVYGARAIIRIGTCGSLSRKNILWSPIITTACFSDEGTSGHYLPKGFPLISDFRLNNILIKHFKDGEIKYQSGVTVTSDGRWREDPELLKKLSSVGAVSIEMETAAIIAVCQFRKIPVAAINIPADLPADEDNKYDFKGIPDRSTYPENLTRTLTLIVPVIVDSAVQFCGNISNE